MTADPLIRERQLDAWLAREEEKRQEAVRTGEELRARVKARRAQRSVARRVASGLLAIPLFLLLMGFVLAMIFGMAAAMNGFGIHA